MKINFTKKQYRNLLELLYLGEWTGNSTKDEEERNLGYDEVYQHALSFAKDFGCEDIIEYDEQLDGHMETLEYEEKMQEQIAEYDTDALWTELAERLARREIEESDEQLSEEAYIMKLLELEEKYAAEFEKSGLEHFELKKN